jgi:hypothetical protein
LPSCRAATIIPPLRRRTLILIAALLSSRLSRYSTFNDVFPDEDAVRVWFEFPPYQAGLRSGARSTSHTRHLIMGTEVRDGVQ